jgi:hypothetical protein
MAAHVRDATGSSDASAVTRVDGQYVIGPFRNQSITALGVVPGEIEQLASWRNDYSGSSLEGLLGPLGEPVELVRGPSVPAGTYAMGVWWMPRFRATRHG